MRAWVLAVQGDAHRAQNERDEARTQFDLARSAHPSSEIAQYATFRLAQTNFELREFAQATADLRPLLTAVEQSRHASGRAAVRGRGRVSGGRVRGRQQRVPARARRTSPPIPQAPAVRLSLAWTAMRQGQRDARSASSWRSRRTTRKTLARRTRSCWPPSWRWPPGSFDTARELLDRMINLYPNHPRAELARLNRTLLLVRRGQAESPSRS